MQTVKTRSNWRTEHRGRKAEVGQTTIDIIRRGTSAEMMLLVQTLKNMGWDPRISEKHSRETIIDNPNLNGIMRMKPFEEKNSHYIVLGKHWDVKGEIKCTKGRAIVREIPAIGDTVALDLVEGVSIYPTADTQYLFLIDASTEFEIKSREIP